MLYGALLLAALVQLAVPAAPALCVVSDDRGDAKSAADAAMSELGTAVRLDVTEATDAGWLESKCSGIVAVGRSAWSATRSAATGPVVGTLIPNATPPEDVEAPRAVIPMEPDPGTILSILAALAPDVRRVGVVYDPAITGDLVARAEEAARERGLELVALTADDQAAAIRAFARLEREISVDALWILPDRTTTTFETAHQALKLAHWKRIPVVGPSRWYAANGALFALESRYDEHGRIAAQRLQAMVDDPENASDTQPPRASLLVNQRSLNRLGLRLTPEVQSQVSELIQ